MRTTTDRIVAAALGAVLLVASPATAKQWDFENGTDGFPQSSQGNAWKAGRSGGEYFIRVCKPATHARLMAKAEVSGDFLYRGKLRYQKACWFDSYQMLAGPDADNHWVFDWIQGDLGCQRYQLSKRGSGEMTSNRASTDFFDDWVFPLHMFNDGKSWNEWKILRQGSYLSFHINDKLAYRVRDPQDYSNVRPGLGASTFENVCGGPGSEKQCLKGHESHFDDLSFEAANDSAFCKRHMDCAAEESCDASSNQCRSATACTSQGECGGDEVCDTAVGRCRPASQGEEPFSWSSAQPEAGNDVELRLPTSYVGQSHVLSIRGPKGAWVTPVILEETASERVYGLPALRPGTYYVEIASNQVIEHASDCGDNKNNDKLDELDLVGSQYLVVK